MRYSRRRAAVAAFSAPLALFASVSAVCAADTLRVTAGVSHAAAPPQDGETRTRTRAATEVDLSALDRIGETQWAAVRVQRICFVHDALGSEIAAGLRTIASRKPELAYAVRVYRGERRARDRSEDETAQSFDRPGIFSVSVGHNGEPEDKIDAFEAILLSDEAATIDVALLKFSCADIGRSTDVNRVLERYVHAIETIRRERPTLRIVHCTAPLREPDHGAKAAIKKIARIGPDAANATRGRFNALLRKRFANETIFDVAAAESVRLDGSEEIVVVQDERWPALAPEYGRGAHDLTDAGRLVLARECLLALARACAVPTAPAVTTAAEAASESTD